MPKYEHFVRFEMQGAARQVVALSDTLPGCVDQDEARTGGWRGSLPDRDEVDLLAGPRPRWERNRDQIIGGTDSGPHRVASGHG